MGECLLEVFGNLIDCPEIYSTRTDYERRFPFRRLCVIRITDPKRGHVQLMKWFPYEIGAVSQDEVGLMDRSRIGWSLIANESAVKMALQLWEPNAVQPATESALQNVIDAHRRFKA